MLRSPSFSTAWFLHLFCTSPWLPVPSCVLATAEFLFPPTSLSPPRRLSGGVLVYVSLQGDGNHPLLDAPHGEEVWGQGPEGGRDLHPEGLAAPRAEPLAGGEGTPRVRDRAVGGRGRDDARAAGEPGRALHARQVGEEEGRARRTFLLLKGSGYPLGGV